MMISWNVYYENFNKKTIEVYDIFNHYGLLSDCAKYADGKDKVSFLEEVRVSLMYYFWAKCEWEITLFDWPPSNKFNDKKISVYDQVMLNWDVFAEYVWEHKEEIIKRKKDYDEKISKKI